MQLLGGRDGRPAAITVVIMVVITIVLGYYPYDGLFEIARCLTEIYCSLKFCQPVIFCDFLSSAIFCQTNSNEFLSALKDILLFDRTVSMYDRTVSLYDRISSVFDRISFRCQLV